MRRWWLCVAVVLILSACGQRNAARWTGYVVGDYVYVASALAGRVDKLMVAAGDQVKLGDALYDLDDALETYDTQEAKARLQNAKSLAVDLDKGKRNEEIVMARAQLAQAQAQAGLAQQNLDRQEKLLAQNFVSKAVIDDARLVLQQAQQKVVELTAAVNVAQMPARQDERVASKASTQAAESVVKENDWRQSQKHLKAMTSGVVSEVYFRVGEFVQAGQPVLSVLPAQNIKVRFFIAQAQLPKFAVGQAVRVLCDGCQTPVSAHISRIATQAEYTPPVIYSNSQRNNMVFMLEAQPQDAQATQLRVGQPIDVELTP
jgi:HlyD family secretion protein